MIADNPGALREGLVDSPLYRSVASDPALDGKLKGFFSALEIVSLMYSGVPFWKTIERHADQVGLLLFNLRQDPILSGFGWALVLDVGRSGEAVDRLLAERVRPRLRSRSTRSKGFVRFNQGGAVIETYPLPGFSMVNMARVDRWFMLGSISTLGSVLRAFGDERDRLADLPEYQEVRRETALGGEGNLFFFVNARRAMPRKGNGSLKAEGDERIRVLGLDRLRAIGGTLRFRRERVEARVCCLTTSTPSGVLGVLECAPVSGLFGSEFVPEAYELLTAVNPGSGALLSTRFWELIAPIVPEMAASAVQFNGAAGQFGVNVHRDILCRTEGDWFVAGRIPPGEALAGGFSRETLLAMQPILGVKVREPEQILQAWQMLATAGMVANQGVRWEIEEIDGHRVHVLRADGKPILGAEFSMAFVGDTWLVTLSVEAMRRALVSHRAGTSLAESRRYRAVRRGLPDVATGMVYVAANEGSSSISSLARSGTSTQATGSRYPIPLFSVEGIGREILGTVLTHSAIGVSVTGRPGGLMLHACVSDGEPGATGQR
ncbi:MAG: hypothetical protein JXQ73_14495 [Phycisphaerae bacterium]|nr:hypothetical protein [Phycisphaerae bacterium]